LAGKIGLRRKGYQSHLSFLNGRVEPHWTGVGKTHGGSGKGARRRGKEVKRSFSQDYSVEWTDGFLHELEQERPISKTVGMKEGVKNTKKPRRKHKHRGR